MTSAVTGHPLDLAQRMISADPAVETWQTCSAEPTCAASRQSRAMMRLLGHGGPARQAQPGGHLALVELRALGEPGVLGVLRDHPVEGLDVLQGPAHQQRVGDAPAVVGEHADPRGRIRHRAELGQPGAREPDGDRADRPDLAVARGPAEPPDLLDHSRGVGHRIGVGHGVHGGKAAEGRRRRPGLHRLGVFAARLAQVRVQVDQAGQGDEAVRVEHPGTRLGQAGPDSRDGPAADHDVGALA